MNILTVDVGGTNVKILASGQTDARKFPSGRKMTPERDVVIGGGSARKLKELPPGCRLGDNACAFGGGSRLWEPVADYPANAPKLPAGGKAKKTKKT